jgi:sortase A
MKIRITRSAWKWTERLMFTSAFFLLAYCIYILTATSVFQSHELRNFERQLSAKPATVTAVAAKESQPILSSGVIGRLEIPRLGISAMVVEGTSSAILQRAVGHIADTAQPGQAGNIGISGHRDTCFRPLRNIHRNDIVTLTTLSGTFNYRVVSTRIVDPAEISVLDQGAGNGESLTLVTCYPFYFVGPAPDRFIVRAERFI